MCRKVYCKRGSTNMRMIGVFLVLIGLCACANSGGGGGGGGGSSSSSPNSKDLQSNWIADANALTHVDITYTILYSGVTNSTYFYYLGGKCDITFKVPSGSNGTAGTFQVLTSSYTGVGNGGVDPGCAGLIGSYTYTNTNASLSMCPVAAPTSCDTYH